MQHVHDYTSLTCDPGRADRVNLPRVLSPSPGGYSPLCQSASRVKLILGLSSTSKVEDLWTTRRGTAYCHRTPFSLIVVALSAMQNSSHLFTSRYAEGFLISGYLASRTVVVCCPFANRLVAGEARHERSC